jgi:hypothetical protein
MFLSHKSLFYLVAVVLISTIGIVSLMAWNAPRVKNPAAPEKVQADEPCWFQKGEEVIKNSSTLAAQAKLRTDRETTGYPSKMSLKDAVALFNSEEKCIPFRGTLPPLTEEEIVAAIVAGPTYGTEASWRAQKPTLWSIAVNKELPPGSLLTAESGACAYDTELGKEVCVEGQRIYLFLGLDKNPRAGTPLKPEQVFLIRANYLRPKKTE